jgi:hypothetical protein
MLRLGYLQERDPRVWMRLHLLWRVRAGDWLKAAAEHAGVSERAVQTYTPELDPVERVFHTIRPEVEGEVYADLSAQALVAGWLRDFAANPACVRALTAWLWLLEQITTRVVNSRTSNHGFGISSLPNYVVPAAR